jgi:hypothetical protein
VYFHLIQSLVCDWALFLILVEWVKLHKAEEQGSLSVYCCTITASIGIPCFHKVFERLRGAGHILPEDVHPFWWYKRPETSTSSAIDMQINDIVLNPAKVRGKGRPKGAKGKGTHEKGSGLTGMSLTSSLSYFTLVV